ncbi:ATP-binding cassette domain-containing protein, partial [Rhizobium sp. Pop5]
IEILQPLSVSLPPTGLPTSKIVLKMDSVTSGYRPGNPVIRDLSFDVTGPERIAVTGRNGSGKTTLLSLVTGELMPWAGKVGVMTAFAMLDQKVSLLDPLTSIRDNFRRINPQADENTCRAALARFMFRADAALQAVSTLSGGQLLRAGLACVLGSVPPPLLILDEPTNHLDIDSISAVEAGLCAYDGALLVVSHDKAFLENIGITRRLELPAAGPAG